MNDLSCWETKFKYCGYSKRLLVKLLLHNKTAEQKIDILEIKKAIYYSKKYHGHQKRDSGEPFYSHPLQVAFMVADYLFRTDLIVTSILHDTIEDTALTKEMIDIIFGSVVAEQVDDLTRVKKDKKISSTEIVESLWSQKKYELLYIKQFDRLHNMQTIGVKPSEKIKKTVEETMIIFLILSAYFEQISIESELHKLCLSVTTIDTKHLNYLQYFFPQDLYSY